MKKDDVTARDLRNHLRKAQKVSNGSHFNFNLDGGNLLLFNSTVVLVTILFMYSIIRKYLLLH